MYFLALYMVLSEFFRTLEIESSAELGIGVGDLLLIIFIFIYVIMVGTLFSLSIFYKNTDLNAIPLFYGISTTLGLYM